MNKTTIDWPDLSFTWNPIVGCSNGCKYCYAKRINDRFRIISDFSKPQFFENRLQDPLKIKKATTIFVGSMCDILDDGVSPEWINKVIDICKQTPRHKYMFLSKKPHKYHRFDWPPNCWLGTTVESGNEVHRISWLQDNSLFSTKHFVSVEPIMGGFEKEDFYYVDLIIVGANSSRGADKPKKEWIESIVHPNIYYKKSIREYYPEFKNQ